MRRSVSRQGWTCRMDLVGSSIQVRKVVFWMLTLFFFPFSFYRITIALDVLYSLHIFPNAGPIHPLLPLSSLISAATYSLYAYIARARSLLVSPSLGIARTAFFHSLHDKISTPMTVIYECNAMCFRCRNSWPAAVACGTC